jgi:chorismate synthase
VTPECPATPIGKLFTVTTFGESHGPALGCIVDGCPPGLALSEAELQQDVDRRRTGTSQFVSQRREPDQVRILSGVFEGRTTGTPIGLLVENTDQRSRDYDKIKDRFRPGHADYTYQQKYGFRDYRGGGRSSARETVMRVAAGAIARKYLRERLGVRHPRLPRAARSAGARARRPRRRLRQPVLLPRPRALKELEDSSGSCARGGRLVGARVTVIATGVPPGLGEPVFDRLDADLAHAMMGINAVKGVEIGAGFAQRRAEGQRAPRRADAGRLRVEPRRRHARRHLERPGRRRAHRAEADVEHPGAGPHDRRRGPAVDVVTTGRHDPCVGLRATPIAEAMLALVLMDHWLRHRAQNADVIHGHRPRWRGTVPRTGIA